MEKVIHTFVQKTELNIGYRFLKNLKIVAVDELHYYAGPLGRFV
jgi:ATP-dependent helicase YprA (DUF1998 family)